NGGEEALGRVASASELAGNAEAEADAAHPFPRNRLASHMNGAAKIIVTQPRQPMSEPLSSGVISPSLRNIPRSTGRALSRQRRARTGSGRGRRTSHEARDWREAADSPMGLAERRRVNDGADRIIHRLNLRRGRSDKQREREDSGSHFAGPLRTTAPSFAMTCPIQSGNGTRWMPRPAPRWHCSQITTRFRISSGPLIGLSPSWLATP